MLSTQGLGIVVVAPRLDAGKSCIQLAAVVAAVAVGNPVHNILTTFRKNYLFAVILRS
jgi:hypothetical protein